MTAAIALPNDQQLARREYGAGTIKCVKGRYYAGLPLIGGERKWIKGGFDTREEAQAVLDAAVEKLYSQRQVVGETLLDFGPHVLNQQELDGQRSVDKKRSSFNVHLATAPFADWPMSAIKTSDVREWLRKEQRKMARDTAKKILCLLNVIMHEAVDAEKIAENPCAGVRVTKKDTKKARSRAFLTREHVSAILAIATAAESCLIRFAIGTGLRLGEMRALRVEDIKESELYVVVRFGDPPNAPTKSGKPRNVPLTRMAWDAWQEWKRDHIHKVGTKGMAKRGERPNELGLAFPTERGGTRLERFLGYPTRGKHPKTGKQIRVDRVRELFVAAGVRPQKDSDDAELYSWHSLRHTAATWLLAGWLTDGRPVPKETVQAVLGHESIATTERYAKLVDEMFKNVLLLTGQTPTSPKLAAASVTTLAVAPTAVARVANSREIVEAEVETDVETVAVAAGETPGKRRPSGASARVYPFALGKRCSIQLSYRGTRDRRRRDGAVFAHRLRPSNGSEAAASGKHERSACGSRAGSYADRAHGYVTGSDTARFLHGTDEVTNATRLVRHGARRHCFRVPLRPSPVATAPSVDRVSCV